MAARDEADPIVALRSVEFDWPGARFGLSVPDFRIMRGESVLLLGRSGSGKSTLLSLISGIISPNAGSIRIDGHDLGKLSGRARDRVRADTIGIVFQMFNLLPYATPLDNILLPLRFSGSRCIRSGNPRNAALALSSTLGLPEALVTRGRSGTLSIGQQQRIAAARALIGNPPLVIADEPTSALDLDTENAFLELMFAQVAASGTTLLVVSHDRRLATRFDRTVEIEEIASRRSSGAAA